MYVQPTDIWEASQEADEENLQATDFQYPPLTWSSTAVIVYTPYIRYLIKVHF